MKWLCYILFFAVTLSLCFGADFPSYSNRLPPHSLIEEFNQSLGAAPGNLAVRPLLPLARDLIKDFEGWAPTPYNDAVNYCTIGYGHLIALEPCSEANTRAFSKALSENEGANLLMNDTRTARLVVQQLVKIDLDNQQFGALSSLVFNIGQRNFSKSTLLKLLLRGKYELASREFAR